MVVVNVKETDEIWLPVSNRAGQGCPIIIATHSLASPTMEFKAERTPSLTTERGCRRGSLPLSAASDSRWVDHADSWRALSWSEEDAFVSPAGTWGISICLVA